MKKNLFAFLLLFYTFCAIAVTPSFSQVFAGKSACFILFDVNQNKMVEQYQYNVKRCAKRIPSDSTFKIPLSLMAFDQKLINQNTVFKWDGKDKGMLVWNQNQTPVSWLKNSTVWVSQQLTPKIGLPKIKTYLQKFHYGNQDFSGDPGKNNGLTHAWLSSSLKISANEQLRFLHGLVTNHLPVLAEAMLYTKANMYLETLPNGWELYGKTGSGFRPGQSGKQYLRDGWFEGFIKKGNKIYIFVTNFTDSQSSRTDFGGVAAKTMTKEILLQEKL